MTVEFLHFILSQMLRIRPGVKNIFYIISLIILIQMVTMLCTNIVTVDTYMHMARLNPQYNLCNPLIAYLIMYNNEYLLTQIIITYQC